MLQLDGQTGKTIREFPVPRKAGGKALRWGYIAVHGNILIGTGATPLDNDYGYLWNSIVKDDQWIPKADVPKRALDTLIKRRNSYEKLTASYATPDARAFAYFKRAGLHWHPMNENPPRWLPDHNPSPVNDTIMTSEKVFAYDIVTGEKLWEH